jgi:hypothetical protein
MNVLRLLLVHFTIAVVMAGGFALVPLAAAAWRRVLAWRSRPLRFAGRHRRTHLRMLTALDDSRRDPWPRTGRTSRAPHRTV